MIDDYTDVTIRAVPWPVPEQFGSWWRRRWTFTVPTSGHGFRVPPPMGEATSLQAVVACWWETDTQLVLDLHTRQENLGDPELTYVSLVAAWLAVNYPDTDILVDGTRQHPLLRMSRLTPEVIDDLRSRGY